MSDDIKLNVGGETPEVPVVNVPVNEELVVETPADQTPVAASAAVITEDLGIAPAPAAPSVNLSTMAIETPTAAAAAQAVAPLAGETKKPEPIDESNFTPSEKKMIEDFSKKIDVTDANLVFGYGAAAQQQIASFSDSALKNVQTKDLGEVGGMISGLVKELKGFTIEDNEERGGFFGLFKKPIDKILSIKNKYDSAEKNVNTIVTALENHQVQLLKDIATLDQLYAQNLKYFKELSMYIEAGKMRIAECRATILEDARKKAETSGLPEDAQAANDLAAKIDRFEKKIYDLELTRNISLQMAPQIRMLQNSNQIMAEKIQSSLVNTIPLWKSQMVMAMGIEHTQSAMEAQRDVSNFTNDLLKKNADMLHQATVETAKESERGIVDIDTLKQTNEKLIQTMDEVLDIQAQGKQKRAEAEKELSDIEARLKAKLLEVRNAPPPPPPPAPAAPVAPTVEAPVSTDDTITLKL